MLCLADLFKGVKKRVEVQPKRGPGRPRKRPRSLEETVAGELPELAEEMQAVKKATKKEFETLSDVVVENEAQLAPEDEALPDVLGQSVETQVALEDEALLDEAWPDEVEGEASSERQGLLVEVKVEDDSGLSLATNAELQQSGQFKKWGSLGKEYGSMGAEYGRLGGRPRKIKVEGQIVPMQKALESCTNRKELSTKSKRDDSFGIVARLEIAKLVRKLLPVVEKQDGALDDVFTYLSDHTGRTKAKIKWAWDNEQLWKDQQQLSRVGAGTKGSRAAQGVRDGSSMTLKTTKGLRLPGGGSKAQLSELYPALKIWFERQRANGKWVDLEMLVLEFEFLMRVSLAGLESKEAKSGLSLAESQKVEILKLKLPKMTKPSTRDYWMNRLRIEVGARMLKPQRLLTLTILEEEHRLYQTWRDFDFRLWNMCFGDLSWLEQHVMDPQSFRENIKSTVLSWSDQIPFWVKIQSTKQLFASWEVSTFKRNPVENLLGSAHQMSQNIEGMSQTRGAEVEGGDKYRITLEVQQDLYNFLNPDLGPVAKHGRPLLILIGKHARLSNLDDDGRFIRTEQFEFCGTPVLRKAGTSARGLLKSWVELRKTLAKDTLGESVEHGCKVATLLVSLQRCYIFLAQRPDHFLRISFAASVEAQRCNVDTHKHTHRLTQRHTETNSQTHTDRLTQTD